MYPPPQPTKGHLHIHHHHNSPQESIRQCLYITPVPLA